MKLVFKGKVLTDLRHKPLKDYDMVPSTDDPEKDEPQEIDMTMDRVVPVMLENAAGIDPQKAHRMARKIRDGGSLETTKQDRDLICQAVRTAAVKNMQGQDVFNNLHKGQILDEIDDQIEAARIAAKTSTDEKESEEE